MLNPIAFQPRPIAATAGTFGLTNAGLPVAGALGAGVGSDLLLALQAGGLAPAPFMPNAFGFGAPAMFAGPQIGFPQQFAILALPANQASFNAGAASGAPQQQAAGNAATSPALPRFGQQDFVDFLLAGSKGGTAGTDEAIEGRFARPGSRFGTAGNNEFQAFTAFAYANQFKSFAVGKDAVFAPGKDINQLAANVADAQNVRLTPEAETLANVAALYRGNLPGMQLGTNKPSTYNNPVLRDLLVQWGRTDLASKPGVGQTDVESIGSVIKALNEQQDPNVRKAWLQQIFDFQGNSPSSPSGAVPNVREYQVAIDLYRNGGYAQLLNNFGQGVRTNGPVQAGGAQAGGVGQAGAAPALGGAAAEALPGGAPRQQAGITPEHDFRQLSNDQRTQMSGLNDRERAIVHLWGRQMIAKGGQDGGILLTVMEDVQKQQGGSTSVSTKPAEVELAREMIAKDQAEFGGVTGKNLDREFFDIMAKKFGDPGLAQRYANSPVFFAANDPNGAAARLPEDFPVDSPQWEAAMSRRSKLSSFENAVLRQWGHDTLDGGGVDGSILAFTLMSNSSLDKGMNKQFSDMLLKADAADGSVDGSSLRSSFKDVMDKLYLNAPGASAEKTFADAQTRGSAMGFSLEQMGINMQQGAARAMGVASEMIKNHPVISTMAAGGLVAATAVCPFLGGLGAGAAGLAMGQKMINGGQRA